MPEPDAVPNQHEFEETPIRKPALHGQVWHFVAALTSAVVPGTGQIILGARHKGVLLSAAFGLFVVAMWPLRVMETYSGYVISVCVFLILVLIFQLQHHAGNIEMHSFSSVTMVAAAVRTLGNRVLLLGLRAADSRCGFSEL